MPLHLNYNFKNILLDLYQILKHHIENGRVTDALTTCRRFGSQVIPSLFREI